MSHGGGTRLQGDITVQLNDWEEVTLRTSCPIPNEVQLAMDVQNGKETMRLHGIPELESSLVTGCLHYEFTAAPPIPIAVHCSVLQYSKQLLVHFGTKSNDIARLNSAGWGHTFYL